MKLLITGAWKCSGEEINQIESLGHKVIFMQNEKDNIPCDYAEIEGVVCNGLFLSHPIEKFVNLKFIQLTSAGFDRVPMEYAKKNNIEVFNARGVYSIPMAEFAICGVLQIYKQSRFFCENQKESKWEKNRELLELNGKTVCIVGCGNVGTECAKRFKAFSTRVIGVDIFVREDENYEKIYPLSELEECLSISNVVVLTLPLTEQTKGLMNEKSFAKMKDNSVLVNIARGAVVEEKALINAFDNKLLGAVLDVFEEEPLVKDNPLWKKKNAIITPHNSFVGDGNNKRLFSVVLNNLGERL